MPSPARLLTPIVQPRLNPVGYCRLCLSYDCRDADCIATWASLEWRPCLACKGSGYADIDAGPDNASDRCEECTDGLVEYRKLAAVTG